MGVTTAREQFLGDALYSAYRAQKIPPSPGLDEFTRLHQSYLTSQKQLLTVGIMGFMPISSLVMYRLRGKPPSLEVCLALFFSFCMAFIPQYPSNEEIELMRREVPKYWSILVQEKPILRYSVLELVAEWTEQAKKEEIERENDRQMEGVGRKPQYLCPKSGEVTYVYGSLVAGRTK